MAIRSVLSDPMLRMLAAATLLAAVLPATGSGRDIAQFVANAAIFVLFLLNGLRIARADVVRGFGNWRFFGALLLWVFGAMAAIGLGLSSLANDLLPPMIALGFLYLGVLPSTVQSATSYTGLAGGTVALSVVSAAVLNILGVFVAVPLFVALGGSGEGAIGNAVLVKILTILILPFALGQIFQIRARSVVGHLKGTLVWVDRFVIAIAVYVAFSGAVEQGIWTRIDPAGWAITVGLVALFLIGGHLGAWWLGRTIGLPFADRIAFMYAGAQKSAAVGAPLATILFVPSVAGFIVVPLLLYHFLQLVIAAPLSTWLRLQHPRDADDCSAPTTRS